MKDVEVEMQTLRTNITKEWPPVNPTVPRSPPLDSSRTRELLLDAVEEDVTIKLQQLCKDVQSLGDHPLLDPKSKATILHTAIMRGKLKSAQFLIESTSSSFLMQDFDVVIKNHTSKKSTLHLLAECGNLALVKALLSVLSNDDGFEDYLRRTVLMEIAGQRPRELSAIHIAAFNGHTDIVELLVSRGIDVNSVNSKNDSVVLWAARNNHIETVRALINLGKNSVQLLLFCTSLLK